MSWKSSATLALVVIAGACRFEKDALAKGNPGPLLSPEADAPRFENEGDDLGGGGAPGAPGADRVGFSIRTARKRPISPLIYGFNDTGENGSHWNKENRITFFRQGGNRLSAYNWENNISHAGSDWQYENDDFMCSHADPRCHRAGEAVRRFAEAAFSRRASILLTLPLLPFVAWKDSRTERWSDVCPEGKISDTWECLDDGDPQYPNRAYLKSLFRRSLARKGAAFTLTPDADDEAVYQDEFVNWVKETFKNRDPESRILFELDNEPELWGQTHNRVRPGEDECRHNATYEEVVRLNLEYAASIRDVVPEAVVMGPVNSGWYGMRALQGMGSCDGHDEVDFLDSYLDALRKDGRSLVNVLDFHWYSEARPNICGVPRDSGQQGNCTPENDGEAIDALPAVSDKEAVGAPAAAARVQAPRSLWDPTYQEISWITWRDLQEPIRLIPRIQEKIDSLNPGMGIAITEYGYGGENEISGGVAEADALGIFGREGIFAATFWPLDSSSAYVLGAIRMFRNFDGKGGAFGNLAVEARSDNVDVATVYAALDSERSDRLTIVAINKSLQPTRAHLEIAHARLFSRGKSFVMSGAAPGPRPGAPLRLHKNRGDYTMPAMSVSTLVLVP